MVKNKSLKGSTTQATVEHWLRFSNPDKIEEKIREWNKMRETEKSN